MFLSAMSTPEGRGALASAVLRGETIAAAAVLLAEFESGRHCKFEEVLTLVDLMAGFFTVPANREFCF